MPHIPRSLAPLASAAPRAPLSQGSKPPVPYMGSSPGEVAPNVARKKRSNGLVKKLSMSNWDVSPERVIKHLMNKELDIDEHSRLVSDPQRPAQQRSL